MLRYKLSTLLSVARYDKLCSDRIIATFIATSVRITTGYVVGASVVGDYEIKRRNYCIHLNTLRTGDADLRF